jgi:hypothetical protein
VHCPFLSLYLLQKDTSPFCICPSLACT